MLSFVKNILYADGVLLAAIFCMNFNQVVFFVFFYVGRYISCIMNELECFYRLFLNALFLCIFVCSLHKNFEMLFSNLLFNKTEVWDIYICEFTVTTMLWNQLIGLMIEMTGGYRHFLFILCFS